MTYLRLLSTGKQSNVSDAKKKKIIVWDESLFGTKRNIAVDLLNNIKFHGLHLSEI